MSIIKYNTRIIQKHDTSTNWLSKESFIPLNGEIIIYDDLKQFKVGDGINPLSALPFYNMGWQGEVDNAVIFNSINNKGIGQYSASFGFKTAALGSYSFAEGTGRWLNLKLTGSANATTYTCSNLNSEILDLPTINIVGYVIYCPSTNTCAYITSVAGFWQKVTLNKTLSSAALDQELVYIIFGAATNNASHSEGDEAVSYGHAAHAEGGNVFALGNWSHGEGYQTIAGGNCQHVQGKWNKIDLSSIYAHIVGNGTGPDASSSNAHTLDWSGNAWYAGDIRVGGTSYADADVLTTKTYVDSLQTATNAVLDKSLKGLSVNGKVITYTANDGTTGTITTQDTDTKVIQTVTTTDAEYPLLASTTANATSTATTTARFASGVTLNPADNSITATSFKGEATSAVKDVNGNDIERIYCSMIPYGAAIPANADLNTTTYLTVGNYYCSKNADVATLSNCPTDMAFMMQVYSPLSQTIDNETTKTWVYRLRKIITHKGVEYYQSINSGATAGTFTYGDWVKTANDTDLAKKADKSEGTFFVEGSGTTDSTAKTSTWVGTSDRITSYYDGLTIRYKIGVAGQSTVTLNINGLGAKTVYRFSTSKLTTHFPVGSIITLIYHTDLNGGCWLTNDYDANTNTYQRVYSTTTNKEYPITARYNNTTGETYYAEYGRYSDGVTLNPSTNTITATTFKGALAGNADTATKLAASKTITLSGDVSGSVSFDGSENATLTATVADSSHNHSATNITSGTLAVDRGGTGYTTLTDTTYTTARYRGSSLHSATTTPTVNGVIAWQYE